MLKTGIEPRLYQQTVFHTATTANTLVVLPTGLGKTLVGAMLASHRLRNYPGSKILLLAPTRPLAHQHKETFERDLHLDSAETVLFTGNVPPAKRATQWENAKVIFSTPQGLENDLVSGRINLKEVSLVIFDEAHRAVGDYAYVFIADRYRKQAEHERILALTASPGDDKETIEELCRNLSIEQIEVRSQESPDVRPYVQEIEIEHVRVAMPEEFKALHASLTRCYARKLDDIVALGLLNRQGLQNKTSLLRAQAALHAQAAKGRREYADFKTMSLLAEALKLQHAIELIETQGRASLTKYMEKLRAEAARGQSKAVQNVVNDVEFKRSLLLLEQLHVKGVEHPKLRALKKIVLKELYQDKGTKIIIFNQYRDQAVEIQKALESLEVSSKIFVGQMKKGDTGMSQKEQQQILQEYRDGVFNCLIATSVAEEGLDIPKVDTVIFYEPIPSAIRTVQRRGRTGRQEKGRIVMLVTEGTRDVAYRYAAHHKERRMYRVLEEVRRDFKGGHQQERPEQRTLPTKKGPVIVADHREKAGGVLKALMDMEVNLRLEQLAVGDYLLSDRVVVEYKTVPDFVESIVDGRLLQQLRALRRYPRPLLIVEGEADLFSVRKVHRNAILGMLAAITVSYNIPILFTRESGETAALLALIAKRETETGRQEYQQHGQKPSSNAELQEYFISSLPGVGSQLAKRLLGKFTTVKNIVDADADALAEIEKIGQKKAKELADFFNEKYTLEE